MNGVTTVAAIERALWHSTVEAAVPSGVVAVAARIAGQPEVLVASSFTAGVSQNPPMVALAVQHTSRTWPRLAAQQRVGVSLLSARHTDLVRQLASHDRRNRFRDVPWAAAESGAVTITDASLQMQCCIEQTYPAGDHDIVVLQIEGLTVADAEHAPLVRYQSKVRPL